MPSPPRSASDQALDKTYNILRNVLESLQEIKPKPLEIRRVTAPSSDSSTTSFSIETQQAITRRVHCTVAPDSERRYRVRVVFDEGPSRHFTFSPKVGEARLESTTQLARAISAFILNELNRSRKTETQEIPPHVPRIELNQNGDIEHMNAGALRVLEYSTHESFKACFFSHVHRRNLWRVMRDLADLIQRKLQCTRWLLRLRTGKGRYCWFRARAENVRFRSMIGVRVLLQPL